MSTEWKKHNFTLLQTEDGSPSLVVDFANGTSECMHHRGGAWSETKMIYAEPARVILQAGGEKFLSVGLGLAYNEMMLMALSWKFNRPFKLLQSYEAEPFLIENFRKFIFAEEQAEGIRATYQQIFDLITRDLAADDLAVNNLRAFMQEKLRSQHLNLLGSLGPQTLPQENFDYILFDAFSNKSTPELWSEEFLTQFFLGLGENCVVSTYACTGALKRALKKTGFHLLVRQGFAGRRESTLAVKGQKYLTILLFGISEHIR